MSGATHRAIALRAGLPASTTTYFFSSIDELLVEALTHFTQERVAYFEALSGEVTGSPSELSEVAMRFAQALCSHPTHEAAQFEVYLDAARPESRHRQVAAAIFESFERVTIAALETLRVENPKAIAPMVIALADGYALHGRARGDEPLDPAPLADALLLLVQSLQPPG